jgi:hypothetical protein
LLLDCGGFQIMARFPALNTIVNKNSAKTPTRSRWSWTNGNAQRPITLATPVGKQFLILLFRLAVLGKPVLCAVRNEDGGEARQGARVVATKVDLTVAPGKQVVEGHLKFIR